MLSRGQLGHGACLLCDKAFRLAVGAQKRFDFVAQLVFARARSGQEIRARFRRKLYLEFFAWKCLYQPVEVLRHAQRLFRRRFQTKMEMVAYRVLSDAMRPSRAG